jgi:hypothetical protein
MGNKLEEAKSCEGCIFAGEPDNTSPNTCKIDVLDRLIDGDASWESDYGYNYWSFSTPCYLRRDSTWKSERPGKSIKELHQIAREEIRFRPDIVLYVDKESDLEDVRATLTSILSQGADLIKSLWLVINNKDIKQLDGVRLLDGIPKNFTTRINKIHTLDWGWEQSLDHVYKKLQSNWLSLVFAGAEYPRGLFSLIDERLNEDLDRFMALTDGEAGFFFVQHWIYNAMGGCTGIDPEGEYSGHILDKISLLARNEGKPYYIKEIKAL